jgi:hypothetical protein
VTAADRQAAAETLRRVVELVELGELDAPGWYVQRLLGAAIALDAERAVR